MTHMTERSRTGATNMDVIKKKTYIMKRFFIIFVMVIMSVSSAFSQTYSESKWIEKIKPADELKGNDEYTLYAYISRKDGYSIMYRNDDDFHLISLHLHEGIFDANYKNEIDNVLIGFYKNGEMKSKISTTVDSSKDYKGLYIHGMDGLTIMTWLEHGGDVRIIAPRYSRSSLDVIIPHRLEDTKTETINQ